MSFNPSIPVNSPKTTEHIQGIPGKNANSSEIETVKAEFREYTNKHIDETVAKPEAYMINKTGFSSNLKGIDEKPGHSGVEAKGDLPILQNLSKQAQPLALGMVAQAISQAMHEVKSPSIKTPDTGRSEISKILSSAIQKSEQVDPSLTEMEKTQILSQAETLYETAKEMIGKIDETKQKSLMWSWKKV